MNTNTVTPMHQLLTHRAGGIQQEQAIVSDLWADDQLAGLEEDDCDDYLVFLEQSDALLDAINLVGYES